MTSQMDPLQMSAAELASTMEESNTPEPTAASTRRLSVQSSSSESSFHEAEIYDDEDSIMEHANDSQSSLGVSLEEIELDAYEFEQQCRISPISRLPAELLMNVFSKLPTICDIKNCMLVSKLWARNSVDLLWHRPTTNNWKNLKDIIRTAQRTDGFFAYHDLIKRLNLAQLADIISDGTLQPITGCKRIERLTLTNCNRLTDLSVAELIDGNKNLLAIDVTGLDMITDHTMNTIANNCHKLQGLNVSKCTKLSDDSLVQVAEKCHRVKRLKFNECPQLTDYSIMSFASHCRDLLEIDLYQCEALTDMSVTALLSDCKQLRELRLAHCTQITDNAFLRLPSEQVYDSLRILDLTNCVELQDAGLQKIVSAAPRLRNLVLAKCRRLTDRGVMAIARLGKNLHYLHLGNCSLITDIGAKHLVQYCNRIRYIDLANCIELTDDSVTKLATLPKLKRIGLVKCSEISDNSIEALARAGSHGGSGGYGNCLERLHLSYCAKLTIKSIRTLLLHCPRLTHLSLTGVNDFLVEDILAFCREAPQEFTENQRNVFCVFSGQGVVRLRDYLSTHYNSEGISSQQSVAAHNHPNGDAVFAPPFGYTTTHNDPRHRAFAHLFPTGLPNTQHPLNWPGPPPTFNSSAAGMTLSDIGRLREEALATTRSQSQTGPGDPRPFRYPTSNRPVYGEPFPALMATRTRIEPRAAEVESAMTDDDDEDGEGSGTAGRGSPPLPPLQRRFSTG